MPYLNFSTFENCKKLQNFPYYPLILTFVFVLLGKFYLPVTNGKLFGKLV